MERVLSEDAIVERIACIARVCAVHTTAAIAVRPAYSVKTNPDARILAHAREAHFRAEVIGGDELAWSRQNGFAPEEIIYNGPEPIPECNDPERVSYCFADSVEAWERCAALRSAAIAGIRFRPTRVASRFGVPPEDDDRLTVAVAAVRPPALAVSMHVRRQDYGTASWLDLCEDLIARGRSLERRTGVPIAAFDVGGGWEPHQFDAFFDADVRQLIPRLRRALPRVHELLVEPGQAIATPVQSLLTTVLEVRRRNEVVEVIIDAGYNDWPQQHTFVHRVSIRRNGVWQRLAAGSDRIGGRTCLEYDRIEGLALPPDVKCGDVLQIGDVGAYDASMAFCFGRGG